MVKLTHFQETILDELNIAAEKEAEISGKTKQLEDDVRKEKGVVLELQGKAVLAQKQIALLEETIKVPHHTTPHHTTPHHTTPHHTTPHHTTPHHTTPFHPTHFNRTPHSPPLGTQSWRKLAT
jgi:hypothetical protein